MRMGLGATSAAAAVLSGLSGVETSIRHMLGWNNARFLETEPKYLTLAYALKKAGYSDREIVDVALNASPGSMEPKGLLNIKDLLRAELPNGADALRGKALVTRHEVLMALFSDFYIRLTPQEALELSVRKLSEEMGTALTYQNYDFNGTIIRAQVSSGNMTAGFSGTMALRIDPLRGVIGSAAYVGFYPEQAGCEFERTMLWRRKETAKGTVILEAVRNHIDNTPTLFNYPGLARADERQIQFLGLQPRPDNTFGPIKCDSPAYRSAAGQ